MNTSDIVILSIYAIGLVLTPLFFGMLFGCNGDDDSSSFEVGVPVFFLSALWPFFFSLSVAILLAFMICWIPGWIFSKLFRFGKMVRETILLKIEKRKSEKSDK